QGEAFNLNSILQGKPNALEQHIDTLESLLQHHVFRIPPRQWLDLTGICQLHTWSQTEDSIAAEALLTICNQAWASQGISRCAALPDIDDTAMQERLTQPDAQKFVEQPEWQQSCRETGAFTRQADQPLIRALCQEFDATLLPRWTARLVELARIPQQLRNMLGGLQPDTTTPQSNADEAGNGLKQVEAARGRLTHHVQLSNGIITRYRIVSPTEWNFHPQGVATQSLANLTHSKQPDIEQTAHLLINAIDPCVSYQLRIH
ncbi:MAG TPA: hypothetical protein EYP90_14645, partial [Chromatiaceae bacterium]|nr:hypothetical protein [Chromatiaceae bacterium]